MALLRPFPALRPTPAVAARVSALPYDVMSRDEAKQLAAGNPLSFLHVSRAEIDLPDTTDPYSAAVYEKARANFERLIKEAPLETEREPSLYFYRLTWMGRSQTGIFGTFSIDEYERGEIRRHEKTRKEKEDDRTHHLLALGAQTGPVFLTYRGLAGVAELTQAGTLGAPFFDFTAPDGVTHTIWKAKDPGALSKVFAEVPRLYIADGHHRAASAWRTRTELRSKNPAHTGTEPYNYFVAVAFPAEELRILPYHRVLKDLHGHSPDALLERLEKGFAVSPNANPEPARGVFSLYLEGQWWGLKPKAPVTGDRISRLDVSVLQNLVLSPIFGIEDPRTDSRIDFVGGIRGVSELEMLVKSGKAKAAFAMHATTMEELMAVSDDNAIMPPKSTWFEPKLRDGLLSYRFV